LRKTFNSLEGSPPPTAPSWTGQVLAASLSGIIFVFAHFPALTRYWVINDDVRQQIFWMQRWRDAQLFPGDLLTDYARAYVTWEIGRAHV